MKFPRVLLPFVWSALAATASALATNGAVYRLLAPGADDAAAEASDVTEGTGDPGLQAVGEGTEAQGPVRVVAQTLDGYLSTILGRNLFDPKAVGQTSAGAPGEDGEAPMPTGLDLVLTGTLVGEPAVYSVAFLKRANDTSAVGYGVGQTIKGYEAVILEVEAQRVKVRHNGNEVWLSVGDKAPKAPEAPEGDAAAGEGSVAGIEAVSETEFNVTKAVVDENLANLDGLSKLGRALLHRGADGEYDGYRLSAIRRGSVAEQLGIRNGDIIHAVNGTKLSSVQAAMEAFQAMSGGLAPGGALQFEVTRRGSPVTLKYNVK
jgi:type II secretion system protein C